MTLLSTVPRRTLGRTGLEVSILGFGTAPLGDLYARLDDRTAIAAVERAFEVGINLLDTSPLYGRGLAEHRCGTAMRRTLRRDIVVRRRRSSHSSWSEFSLNATSSAD
jgi:D-threo-aldose 1-dehydrogenase